MKNLKELYNEWRIIANEFIEEEGMDAYDCGNPAAKESFEKYTEQEIDFEKMLTLEQEWNKENL